MITINIDPVAFSIGALEVRWYGIMVAVAVIALLAITFHELKRRGIPEGTIFNLFFWGVVGGAIGGKLVYLFGYWQIYGLDPSEILSPYGWALHGTIIGVVLAGTVYWSIITRKISFQELLGLGDAVAPGAPLAQAIGRVGCALNGCCWGTPTSLPWAVVSTNPDSFCGLKGIPIHPAQIYFVLWNMAVFAVVWRLRNRLKPDGSLFFVYLSLYCAGDFVLRFFRDDPHILGALEEGQIISLIILAIALPLLIIRMREFRKKAGATPASEPDLPQNQQG